MSLFSRSLGSISRKLVHVKHDPIWKDVVGAVSFFIELLSLHLIMQVMSRARGAHVHAYYIHVRAVAAHVYATVVT